MIRRLCELAAWPVFGLVSFGFDVLNYTGQCQFEVSEDMTDYDRGRSDILLSIAPALSYTILLLVIPPAGDWTAAIPVLMLTVLGLLSIGVVGEVEVKQANEVDT